MKRPRVEHSHVVQYVRSRNEPSGKLATEVVSKIHTDSNFIKPSTDQRAVYDIFAGDVVKKLKEGKNATLLAYGPTGSGKTFSLTNLDERNRDNDGILPRICTDIERECGADVKLSAYAFQIYLGKAYDLSREMKIVDGRPDASTAVGE